MTVCQSDTDTFIWGSVRIRCLDMIKPLLAQAKGRGKDRVTQSSFPASGQLQASVTPAKVWSFWQVG